MSSGHKSKKQIKMVEVQILTKDGTSTNQSKQHAHSPLPITEDSSAIKFKKNEDDKYMIADDNHDVVTGASSLDSVTITTAVSTASCSSSINLKQIPTLIKSEAKKEHKENNVTTKKGRVALLAKMFDKEDNSMENNQPRAMYKR